MGVCITGAVQGDGRDPEEVPPADEGSGSRERPGADAHVRAAGRAAQDQGRRVRARHHSQRGAAKFPSC